MQSFIYHFMANVLLIEDIFDYFARALQASTIS